MKTENPKLLWEVLKEISQEVPGFSENLKIQLMGKVSPFVLDNIQKKGLDTYTEQVDYVPHNEVQVYQQKSQVLLLAINNVPECKGNCNGKGI